MTIIETAAIAWAVVATGGAGAVYGLMRRECRALDKQGYGQYARAEKLARHAAVWETGCDWWRAKAIDAEDRLRKIEQSRHLSAKHARAAQIAQQRAARDAKTAELARGVAAQTTRQAA